MAFNSYMPFVESLVKAWKGDDKRVRAALQLACLCWVRGNGFILSIEFKREG